MSHSDAQSDQRELARLREEHRQISDLLSLIQQLTAELARVESHAQLFAVSFRALSRFLPFDVAVAVMLEQNLDLYISSRPQSESLVNDRLVDKVRATLHRLIPVSLGDADAVVKSEVHDLVATGAAEDNLRFDTHAILKQENRTAGLLLLYRGGSPFSEEQRQFLEIFSTQASLLLDSIRAREKILNLADTDDLTGIWNKRFFRRQLPQEVERARVYTLPLSLLIFDVDDFKQINDSFGHTVGDVVLSELCGAVREMLRPPDFFARFGGDEFSIILPHTDLGGAVAVAERILKKVSVLTIPTDEEASIRCSISIGIADYQGDSSAIDLVRRADERLYEAKRAGKNRYAA